MIKLGNLILMILVGYIFVVEGRISGGWFLLTLGYVFLFVSGVGAAANIGDIRVRETKKNEK